MGKTETQEKEKNVDIMSSDRKFWGKHRAEQYSGLVSSEWTWAFLPQKCSASEQTLRQKCASQVPGQQLCGCCRVKEGSFRKGSRKGNQANPWTHLGTWISLDVLWRAWCGLHGPCITLPSVWRINYRREHRVCGGGSLETVKMLFQSSRLRQ
jgi:hypothetical protein